MKFFKRKVIPVPITPTPEVDETVVIIEDTALTTEVVAVKQEPETVELPTLDPIPEAVPEALPVGYAPAGLPLTFCTDVKVLQGIVTQLFQLVDDLQKTEALSQGDNWYFRKVTTIVNSRANLTVKSVDGVLYLVNNGS